MRSFIRISFLVTTFGLGLSLAACGGKASCDKVVEKTVSLLPAELTAKMDTKDMVAKCEKELSPEQRECIVKAATMEDAASCQLKK
jgi:hypothetical protein